MSKRMFNDLKKTIEQKNKKYKKNLKNELDNLVKKIETKINDGYCNNPIIEECIKTQKEINNSVDGMSKDIDKMKQDIRKMIEDCTNKFKNLVLKYSEMINHTSLVQQNLNTVYKNYLKTEEEKKLELFNILNKDKLRLKKHIEKYSYID